MFTNEISIPQYVNFVAFSYTTRTTPNNLISFYFGQNCRKHT